MKRLIVLFVVAMTSAIVLSVPAHASVRWICDVPSEGEVTFVTAADAAAHGIRTANAHAGQTFHLRFGEVCRVAGP